MITYSISELNSSELETIAQNMVEADRWKVEQGYDTEKMYIGLLGETAYSLHTNQRVNKTVYRGGDGGIDFPDGSNVKTRKISPGYVPDLMVSRKDIFKKKADTYIYAIYNQYKDKVALIGKITADTFTSRAKLFNTKTHMVEMRYSIDSLDEVYDNVTHNEVQKFCN